MSTNTKTAPIAEEKQGKHFSVPVQKIRPLQRAGGNIRTDYGDLTELAISIFHEGIIMPMRGYRVEDEQYDFETFDGHRRLKAAMMLVEGFTHDIGDGRGPILYKSERLAAKIIIVRADQYSDEQIVLDMITTNSGKQLNPVEQAEAARRLKAFGWDEKEIAARFGKTQRFVQNLLLLASAPLRIRKMVSAGTISYTLVGDIFKRNTDYNAAIAEIEASLGVARSEAKAKKGESDTDGGEEGEGEENNEGVRVTKRHLDKAINRVDSTIELKIVFKRLIDNPKTPTNPELYAFAKELIENRLTAATIEKRLFNL